LKQNDSLIKTELKRRNKIDIIIQFVRQEHLDSLTTSVYEIGIHQSLVTNIGI